MGLTPPALRAEVRNGDTTASARAAMIRRPPNFLVTTPESLYLLVTAGRSRATLASVRTVIVDEIHAVARDKRGSHLALTLERLERLCDRRPVRIGLSATQRPIETVARLLVGAGPDRSDADGAAPLRDRRRRPPAAARPGHRAARRRARGGRLGRTARRGARPHRRPRPGAPHHAGLRQHPAHGRAHRPPAGRAAGRRRGRRPPRQPVQGPPAAGRDPAAGRRAAGPGGDRLARAGHRHRPGRAGVPDRLAPQPGHLPAAGRPVGAQPGRHAQGPPVPHDPRRTGRVLRAAGRRPGRPPGRDQPAGGAARHPGPADRGRVRGASGGGRTTSTNWSAGPRPTPS